MERNVLVALKGILAPTNVEQKSAGEIHNTTKLCEAQMRLIQIYVTGLFLRDLVGKGKGRERVRGSEYASAVSVGGTNQVSSTYSHVRHVAKYHMTVHSRLRHAQ